MIVKIHEKQKLLAKTDNRVDGYIRTAYLAFLKAKLDGRAGKTVRKINFLGKIQSFYQKRKIFNKTTVFLAEIYERVDRYVGTRCLAFLRQQSVALQPKIARK